MTSILQRLFGATLILIAFGAPGIAPSAGAQTPGASEQSTTGKQDQQGPSDGSVLPDGAAKNTKSGTAVQEPGEEPRNNVKRIAPKSTLANDIAQPLALLLEQIDNAKKAIERLKNDDKRLAGQRDLLDTIPARAAQLRSLIEPRLQEVVTLAAKLGPAPQEGKPAETQTLAATRAKLTKRRSILESAIKESQLIETRARQLIADIQTKRQRLFAANLFARTKPPLSADYWQDLGSQMPTTTRQLSRVFGTWLDSASVNGFALLALFIVAIGLGVYMWRLAQELIQTRLASVDKTNTDFAARSKLIAWILPTRLLPYGLALAIILVGLSMFDMLSPPVGIIVLSAVKALTLVIFVSALARTILAPRHPQWRLVNLTTPTVTRLYILLVAIAAVYGLDIILSETARVLFQPLAVRILGTFLTSSLLALLLLAVALLSFERMDDADKDQTAGQSNNDPEQAGERLAQNDPATHAKPAPIVDTATMQLLAMRALLLVLAATILLTTLSGYVALGGFVARQVVVSGSIIGIGILVHLAISAYAQELSQSAAQTSSSLPIGRRFSAPQGKMLVRSIVISLNILMIIVLAPWLLLQWGFNGADIADGVKTTLFGFEIGGVQISIARIVIGVGLFAALVFATRLFQRWLVGTMSARASIDPGVANSIRAFVGYTGMTIAVLSAVSYAGFDISKFAIVAGALSVGIGFGLQSIVNNFVSGLILLAERPIKVGDWIVVGAEQGHVRRISVRATEIETFDKASVIIPNSELIAGRVINWTHRNKLGRAVVLVGVGYQCDPVRVRELLLEIGAAHPKAMKFPAPIVHFDNLGASSLDFSLRVYIADINSRASVQTELRMAIIKSFREHNIEIPFQQHDIHLRDLDGVKQVLTQVIAERNKTRAKVVDEE